MWELTKRILLRISSVLSKVEPEPDLCSGSDKKVPAPTGSGSATLYKCILFSEKGGSWLQICLEYVKTYLVKTFLSEQELAKKSGVVIKKNPKQETLKIIT